MNKDKNIMKKYIANTSKLVISEIEIIDIIGDLVYFRSITDGMPNACIIHTHINKFEGCTFNTIHECCAFMGVYIFKNYPHLDFTSIESKEHVKVDMYSVDLDMSIVSRWIKLGKEYFPEKFI